MDQQQLIVVAAIVVVAVVAIAVIWYAMRQRRRMELRERFGPEYDHVVRQEGDAGRAERVLNDRQQRVEQLHVRPLRAQDAAAFRERWRAVQARFVDDPRGAVSDADDLIGQAMEARGYPVGDFEQRAADVSVEHPQVVSDYREAHAIARRPAEKSGTEELRRAMVHYRALFAELVGAGTRSGERVEEREEQLR